MQFTVDNDAHQSFAAAVYARANESFARGEPLPPYPPKPSPPRDPPAPDYISVAHPTVCALVHDLDVLATMKCHQYIPRCTETAYALTALAVLDDHTHRLHLRFWSIARRVDTAHRVQRVLNSVQHLILPAPWDSPQHALSTLATREAARAAALQRQAQAPAGGAKAGGSLHKMPRLTRAAAARQIQEQATGMPAPTVATSSTNERKRRRTSPVAAPAPQRASARQQKQRTMVPDGVPPAVIAATTTPPTKRARARSASRESNETLVASSSTSSFSRAASVSSAATIVVEVVNDTSKGKGKARLIVPAPGDDGGVAPMETESVAGTGMVTRSRTKKVPDVKPARAAPYPTAKDAQLAAGRSKSRAPTGKRKVAKSKAT